MFTDKKKSKTSRQKHRVQR